MKKWIMVLSGLLAAASAAHAGKAEIADDAIVGIWATEKAEAHVEIAREPDETYSATIIWLKEPFFPPDDEGGMAGQPKVDRENPDPGLRERPIEGLQIMWGMIHDGGMHWSDGEIYDPENGKIYSAKIRLTDSGTLRVRGYVGISLFGRTTEWTPVLMNEAASGRLMEQLETDEAVQEADDREKTGSDATGSGNSEDGTSRHDRSDPQRESNE